MLWAPPASGFIGWCSCRENSLFAGGETGDDGPVVGPDAPVGNRGNKSFIRQPASFHCGTQQEVINAAIRIVFAVKVSPRDVTRLEIRRRAGRVVAIALGGARVSELEFSASDDFLRRDEDT